MRLRGAINEGKAHIHGGVLVVVLILLLLEHRCAFWVLLKRQIAEQMSDIYITTEIHSAYITSSHPTYLQIPNTNELARLQLLLLAPVSILLQLVAQVVL